jgi:hypothetical protein
LSTLSENDRAFDADNGIVKHQLKTLLPFLKDKSPIEYNDHKALKRHEKIFGILPDKKSEKFIKNRLNNLRQ